MNPDEFHLTISLVRPVQPRISQPTNDTVVSLKWNAVPGEMYQVQVTSNLTAWMNVGGIITNSDSTQTWQDDLSQSSDAVWPARFYRVAMLPPPAPQTNSALLPSEVLNLANWKLTLPIDTSHAGSPDEYLQPELAGFEDTNYFYADSAGDGVVFTAPCGGATTSGSGYPRSELREMTGNGTAPASWSTTSGTNTMEVTEAIMHLPVVKPQVVAGQIHNASDDVITVRLEGTKLFFDQNGVNGPVMTNNYQLGDVFTFKWVTSNGGVQCYYNGQYIYTYSVNVSGCYFKAGVYTQSNTSKGDAPTAYGQVIVHSVKVTHQ